ncbi:MAG TPA: hypothetical protein PKA90_13200 [Ignavibacteria bacterium]|nr:hypothetical protein [Ignavibacteria bacterium]HMR41376.1 hypothetical protein [Ignavibacteria bacterium]
MSKPKTITFNKKSNIFFHMSFEEIMKRFDSLESESEKKHLLEYLDKRETSEENLTEDGLIISDKMIAYPDKFKKFKKWREEKTKELDKNSKILKKIYKLKWNCEAKQVEGLFKSLENSGHIKKSSKQLLNNHFSYKKIKPVPMKTGVEKIIWLKGPVELIWFLYFLNSKKIIDSPEGKVHFSGENHFCNSKLEEYNNRTLLQNLNNKLFQIKKDKNEPHYPEIVLLIKENIPDL